MWLHWPDLLHYPSPALPSAAISRSASPDTSPETHKRGLNSRSSFRNYWISVHCPWWCPPDWAAQTVWPLHFASALPRTTLSRLVVRHWPWSTSLSLLPADRAYLTILFFFFYSSSAKAIIRVEAATLDKLVLCPPTYANNVLLSGQKVHISLVRRLKTMHIWPSLFCSSSLHAIIKASGETPTLDQLALHPPCSWGADQRSQISDHSFFVAWIPAGSPSWLYYPCCFIYNFGHIGFTIYTFWPLNDFKESSCIQVYSLGATWVGTVM